jgi:Protein of unknown function (DUF3040)
VPLSEDEQRILSQIEERFYEDDPEFAREVGQTSLYRHAFRNIKWGLLGFLVGAVFLVATLSTSYLLSFIGFLVIFASAIFIERNARKMGRAGLQQVTHSMRAGGLRTSVGGFGQRLKGRLKRDEE